MKHFLLIAGMATFFCACKKENNIQANLQTQNAYLNTVKIELRDSLSIADFQTLDFTSASISTIDSLNISFVRIALVSKKLSNSFFIAKTDLQGNILKGRFVEINRDSSNLSTFSGNVQYRNLRGTAPPALKFVKGHLQRINSSQVSELKAEDQVVDGGDLPPVIVTYTQTSDGGISYADWYNLVDMAGDSGYNPGYYVPSSGGDGGGGGSAPAEQVDFEALENKDAINVKKFMDCFGASQPANADYTITISVDLPVDGDPTKFFDWSQGSPGHTFVTLYKNDNSNLVEQNIGFYPDMAWKTVVGPDNIASKVVDNGGHEYQAKYEIAVTAQQFQNAINAAQNLSSHQYNIAEYNCADYALGVFRAAGGNLSVPQYVIPGFPSDNGSNTPEGVFNAIQSLENAGNPNAMANSRKQWAGNSHGACD